MGIKNALFDDYTYYHSTLKGLKDKILQEGLRINCIREFSEETQPYIYLSNIPFTLENDYMTFAVDMSDDKCNKITISQDAVNNETHLLINDNIPSKYLKPLSQEETRRIYNEGKKRLCNQFIKFQFHHYGL